jgi:hypothetical protein
MLVELGSENSPFPEFVHAVDPGKVQTVFGVFSGGWKISYFSKPDELAPCI